MTETTHSAILSSPTSRFDALLHPGFQYSVLLLRTANYGDTLELSPSGSWTAAYGTALEGLFDSVSSKLQQTKIHKIDMADVGELDTLGAWLLEKMSRRTLQTGHPTTVIGTAESYAGLIEDVSKVNRRGLARPTVQNRLLARLDQVERSTFSEVQDVAVFLQNCHGRAFHGAARRGDRTRSQDEEAANRN